MNHLTYNQKIDIGFQYIVDAMSPCSVYGDIEIKALEPLQPGMEGEPERQYDNIAKILNHRPDHSKLYSKLERLLMQIKNVRSTMTRCRTETLGEVELFRLKGYLLVLEELEPIFREINLDGVFLRNVTPALDILDPEKSRVAAFYVSEKYSDTLAEIRRQKEGVEEQLAPDCNNSTLIAQRTAIVHREEAEELAIRNTLCRNLVPWLEDMEHNTYAIGEMDLTLQKAAIALRYGGSRPKLGQIISFTEMINPCIADSLSEGGGAFTPISLRLERGATVITGANMGGKSVALKTLLLNTFLAACGFYPFAKAAEICLPHGYFLIAADLTDTARGLSSFGGEMVAFREICRSKEEGALILMDEPARGTNPEEGAAIARALTRYLNNRQDFSLLTTHYDGVAQYGKAQYQVIGLRHADLEHLHQALQEMDGDDPVHLLAQYMDYGLRPVCPGQETPKDAIAICRLLGLDWILPDLMKE